MRNSIRLLALLVLLASKVTAQSTNPNAWCQPGATWLYDGFAMTGRFQIATTYVGDTLIGGQTVQQLRRELFSPANPASRRRLSSTFTRTIGDRVDVLADSQYYTLYDFAAQPGDTWLTVPAAHDYQCTTIVERVTVDSVGTQVIGDRSLRWLRVHLTLVSGFEFNSNWQGRIYEMIGNVGSYLQPQSYPSCGGSDPLYMGPLVSFSVVGARPFAVTNRNNRLALSSRPVELSSEFSIYPNPTQGARLLTLGRTDFGTTIQVRLLDATGRCVRQQQLTSLKQVDINGLPVGVYTLMLQSEGQATQARRVVVSE